MAWKMGPLPPDTFGAGVVIVVGGACLVEFQGDHAVRKPSMRITRVITAEEILWYDNEIGLPPPMSEGGGREMAMGEARGAWLDVSGAFDAYRGAKSYTERIRRELDNAAGGSEALTWAIATEEEMFRRLYLALYDGRATLDEFFFVKSERP